MKRLLVLLIILLAVPSYAQDWITLEDPYMSPDRVADIMSRTQCSEDMQVARLTPAMMGSVPAAAPGVTYSYRLSCDDNAANTAVVDSIAANNWIAASNTTNLHSATAQEGTGSFLPNSNTKYFYSPAAWTSEKVKITFYFYKNANALATLGGVGDRDADTEANEFSIWLSAAGQIAIGGNTGSEGYNWTSDISMDLTTWYEVEIYIDATTNTWGNSTIKYRTIGGSWTTATFAGWDTAPNATTFNATMFFGSSYESYNPNVLIDDIRVEDLT